MRYVVLLIAALALSISATGCNDEITAADIRRDLADDLHTPTLTKGEDYNRTHHTFTINLRKLNDELSRLLLFDRASRGIQQPTVQE